MSAYENPGPTRDDIDAASYPVLLEFGTDWCGHCQAAATYVREALTEFPGVQHIKVEDGPARPLGRSFRVRLWPTLLAIQNGGEVARTVRPESTESIRQTLRALSGQ